MKKENLLIMYQKAMDAMKKKNEKEIELILA